MQEIQATDYTIHIDSNTFEQVNHFLNQPEFEGVKIFIFVDENTHEHCLPGLVWHIDRLKDAEVIETESGEENKNLETCYQLWSVLSELGADRSTLIINLSGGMLSDMAGFVASTFKRGLRFINLPTTLLSMVDASVGGKLGIDLNNIKNQIGLFNSPQAVFISTEFLKTLPERQVKSGLAEVIKHGLIADSNYLNFVENHFEDLTKLNFENTEIWTKVVARSVSIKNSIVNQDYKESGIRKALNFGHTIGHALETWFLNNNPQNVLLHGEAVAAGIIAELYLSVKVLGYSETELERWTTILCSLIPPMNIPQEVIPEWIDLMNHDKKNKDGQINFTFIKENGKPVIDQTCKNELITESLIFLTQIINNI